MISVGEAARAVCSSTVSLGNLGLMLKKANISIYLSFPDECLFYVLHILRCSQSRFFNRSDNNGTTLVKVLRDLIY